MHLRGEKSERPHYHIWLELDEPMTHDKAKDKLREYHTMFDRPFSTWMFSHGKEGVEQYRAWANYVSNAAKGAVILYETPDDSHPPIPAIPVLPPAGGGSAAAVMVKPPTNRTPQRVRFCNYLKTELNWETGCITMINYKDKLRELVDELTFFSENAFTTPNGAATVQHALWMFSDPAVKETIKASNYRAMESFLRI